MEELDRDRLSSLPKEILHCIMSRLPEKDVARTSVLSKAWLDTWYTFPILSFHSSKFMQISPLQPMKDGERMRKILGLAFCYYVKRSILRFWDQNLTIKEFKLRVSGDCFGLDHILKYVDILIKLACECGVEVIEYSRYVSEDKDQDRYHVLPMCVFEAKSLTKLVLWGDIKIDQTFMNPSIKFFSLRVLSLLLVLLGDQHAINNLISFCPSIESITLRSCLVLSSGDGTMEKLKSLSISGLQKLNKIDTFGIQDVFIDSPSLETLWYICPRDFNTPLKIDFDRCKNLKELSMWSVKGTFFTDKWFLEQFPTFPFLESLKLDNCKMPETIDISSLRLKVLEFSCCSNMKEVNIDAPNLLSCAYKGSGTSEPTISFSRNSSQLEVNIQIHVDYADLCNLREFVQNIKPNNVLTSLALSIGDMSNVDAFDPVALQVSCPPPSIKHLDVHFVSIFTEEYLLPSMVDFLLTSCCPASISLRFEYYFIAKAIIELFYETLMERKDEECFCTCDNTRCWWHGLKNVKVTRSSINIKENVDFQTILKSYLAFAQRDNIIFMLDF